ncbi:MAG: tetratricopeptide repeat protein [Acidobacteria bacterium]|jgi:predicted O-linked N-acetylglucosamine transferase (SPINDLY family)|nr:tetratricopeptide repeat protein [Bryobacteraceae bacterium CoA2 C42]
MPGDAAWEALASRDWPRALQAALAAIAGEGLTASPLRVLAISLWGMGNLTAALAALESLLDQNPQDPLYWSDLATLRFRDRQFEAARAAFSRALDLDPGSLAALHGLAETLLRLQRPSAAIPHLEACLRQDPDNAACAAALGQALLATDQAAASEQLVDSALVRHPRTLSLLLLKASLASRATRHQEALAHVVRAAAEAPDSFEVQANLALASWSAGDSAAAFAAQRVALALNPNPCEEDRNLHASLLWLMLHDPSVSAQSIRLTYENSSRFWAGTQPVRFRFPNPPVPDRPLRVGYLSGEFVMNPAFCFLACWLQFQDRANFTSYYYMTRDLYSEHTGIYRQFADHWRNVRSLDDHQLAALIARDEIDILVELSGHFTDHRLSVFARRAAPVQVAFPHFPATTGVAQIDYLLTDHWTTPPQTEAEYTETVYRLPSGYIAFQLAEAPPPITPLPALANGYVTFGLFQRPGKYHAQTWDAIAAILRRLPDSRLLCHYESAELDTPGSPSRDRVAAELVPRGIDAARLLFRGRRPLIEHLGVIAEADIALDSFPYNGQTTTCDCLWMGVPVVNLRGSTHAGRVGQALLQRAGLGHLSTSTLEGYGDIAIALAADLAALAALRAGLRQQAQAALGDGAQLTREIESAYRRFWMEWCARRPPDAL